MHAILEEAIKTFRLHVSTHSGPGHRLFLDAQLWIMSRNDDWLFSFEYICEVLGLDPDFVRSGLAHLKEQQSGPAVVCKTPRNPRSKRAIRALRASKVSYQAES